VKNIFKLEKVDSDEEEDKTLIIGDDDLPEVVD